MKWEYALVTIFADDHIGRTEVHCDKWGAQGWELVSVMPDNRDNGSWAVMFFKRSVKPETIPCDGA